MSTAYPLLADAVAIAFNLDPARITATKESTTIDGVPMTTIRVSVDGGTPSPEIEAFLDATLEAAHTMAARVDASTALPRARPADLDAIEARANAATPGPWRRAPRLGIDSEVCAGPADDPSLCAEIHACSGGDPRADADFIAAARVDVPRLLAAVRAAALAHEQLHEQEHQILAALPLRGEGTTADRVRAELKRLKLMNSSTREQLYCVGAGLSEACDQLAALLPAGATTEASAHLTRLRALLDATGITCRLCHGTGHTELSCLDTVAAPRAAAPRLVRAYMAPELDRAAVRALVDALPRCSAYDEDFDRDCQQPAMLFLNECGELEFGCDKHTAELHYAKPLPYAVQLRTLLATVGTP